jgi:hypothetical protein
VKKYSEEYLRKAHKDSIYHQSQLVKSNIFGCFHCKKTFEFTKINEWTDEDSDKGKTAICPICGIDAVLGDNYPIQDKSFLNEMNTFWFS